MGIVWEYMNVYVTLLLFANWLIVFDKDSRTEQYSLGKIKIGYNLIKQKSCKTSRMPAKYCKADKAGVIKNIVLT